MTYTTKKIIISILFTLFLGSGCQRNSDLGDIANPPTATSPVHNISPTVAKTISPPIETPTNVPSPAPTNTIIPTPTATLTPTVTPFPTVEPETEWQTYSNETHGFTFRYPESWTVIEFLDRNQISLVPKGTGLALRVHFKLVDEEIDILRTGVPAGELINQGEVNFIGQGIAKNVLVWKDADRAILYDNSGEVRRGNLIFTITLEGSGFYEDKIISETVQLVADEILSTFSLVSPE